MIARFLMAGFSLIELLITLVILSIAMSYGIPGYRTWVQNSQIRNAGESIVTGMMRARSEAVKRNTNVAFDFDGDGTASSWVVRIASGAKQLCNQAFLVTTIDVRCANDGSRNVKLTVTPGVARTVTFNNFGIVTANAPEGGIVPPTISRIEIDSLALNTARKLWINVDGLGGNVRMCDPNLAAGNPQAC